MRELERIRAGRQLRVLDFGGGAAALATVLRAYRLRGYEVTIADVDADAMAAGRGRAAAVLLEQDGGLPFPDGAFDVCVSSDVFEHLPPARRSWWAAECRRVAPRQAHTFPCDGGEYAGEQADRDFDAWHRANRGGPERFTAEHLELGLPRAADAEAWFPAARVEGFANVDVWQRLIRDQFRAVTPYDRLGNGWWYYRVGQHADGRPPFKSCLVVA